MQSTNPAMAVISQQAGSFNFGGEAAGATVSGTINKSLLLVLVTLVVGYLCMGYSINTVLTTGTVPQGLTTVAVIVAFIIAMVGVFKPNLAPITAPLYAVAEGAGLGLLSGIFEFQFPGIVSTAVMSTFVVVLSMLALWKFRIIVPTQRFRSIIMGATMGVCVVYLLNMVFSLFGGSLLPQTGALSIGISLLVCAIAAFNLILDFDNIEQCVNQGLPKYFEYYNAFSLLVTICWLYIEILHLLARREE